MITPEPGTIAEINAINPRETLIAGIVAQLRNMRDLADGHLTDDVIVRHVLEVAGKAERESIRQLAVKHKATYQIRGDDGAPQPFADLLGPR
jgi:hypothetical protein